MYDLPAARETTDSWWAGLAAHFRRAGLSGVPDRLTRPGEGPEFWLRPGLLFSQACGYPLVTALTGKVGLLGTPCYDMDGCEGPDYSSFVVVRADSPAADIGDLCGRRCAINIADSWSGHHALRLLLAPLIEKGRAVFDTVLSGGHAASIAAVSSGTADFASVDCVTFGLLARTEPGRVAGLRVLARTAPMPGLPLIAGGAVRDDEVVRMRDGLRGALRDPGLAANRRQLAIQDITSTGAEDYRRISDALAELEAAGIPRLV
jgi:ABC-type phosphate/phosphonate transport system substrate-binding protein